MMRSTSELSIELFDGMHHLSVAVVGRVVPPPEACEILANLEAAGGYNLAEVLTRLAQGIERSFQTEEAADLAIRGRLVAALTRKAADHAQQIALCLGAAHCEIAASQIVTADAGAEAA
ncbi:hypothetical protein ABCS02_33605 [Microbacterium sp. X-17]|uniref:hypothetical protein n=1 Tax=Microbacterium sp. X-17 TaxID=3144404 RepID=UPI0031F5A376